MVGLAIVAVATFIGGVWAATTWLPPLAEGPVGTLVYFTVCGLAGAVLAVFGVHVWQIIRGLEPGHGILASDDFVASELVETLWQSGTLAALALIAYLLAPKGEPFEQGSPATGQ